MSLARDQQRAFEQIINWRTHSDEPEAVLTGAAGTGKTFLLKALADHWDEDKTVRLCAPTGKAADRIREVTKHWASTIHSLLYAEFDEDAEGELEWGKVQSPVPENGLLICDEASMIGSSLHEDVMEALAHGAKVLWVGDPYQLSPVKDTWGVDFKDPLATLTEIHRQAWNSDIIRYATALRFADYAQASLQGTGEVIHRKGVTEQTAAQWLADHRKAGNSATLIAWTNATRHDVNKRVRALRGFRGPIPLKGERVVITQNNHLHQVYNGETYEVDRCTQINPNLLRIQLCGKEDKEGTGIGWTDGLEPKLLLPSMFGADTAEQRRQLKLFGVEQVPRALFRDWRNQQENGGNIHQYARLFRRRILAADWGECLTAHKAQGSQFDHVGLVIDSKTRWWIKNNTDGEARRWLYTAATRAAKQLTLFHTIA